MATLEEYEAVAPTVMSTGEFTLTQIENKLASIPDPPPPPVPPPITRQKVVQIFNLVFDTHSVNQGIENAGGINEIAKIVSLWPSQVKLIISELGKMYAVYQGGQ